MPRHGGELSGERPELVVAEGAACERDAIELVVRGGDELRMAVAEVQRRVGGERVEVAPAAVVADPAALGADDRDRQRVVVVGGVAVGEVRCVACRAPQPDVERKRQAARPAAGLQELRHVDDDGLKAAGAQLALQALRARRHDDGAADHDGVRAERGGLIVGERDRVGHERGDPPRALLVERARRVERRVRVQRAEDDVDVVVARVGELDGRDRTGDDPPEVDVCPGRGPRPVPGDKRLAERQRVAGALLRDVLAQRADREAVLRKPAHGVRGLGTALDVAHARRHERVAVDDPEVGGEDEVGQAGLRREHLDLGTSVAVRRDERVPLALRALAVDRDRGVHPRIDRVRHVEVRGRAHEVAPPPAKF